MHSTAISLGNEEFEGKNNAYLLESGDVTALVDTGIATDEIHDELRDGLSSHGYTFADVDLVLLTHYHPDHAGLAGPIERAGDARIVVHEADAPIVLDPSPSNEGLYSDHLDRFERWGMPEAALAELRPYLDLASVMDPPETVETVTDGDQIEVGDSVIEVVHAPGHTAGLCCFAFESDTGDREAFVGDAILPVYTPNVGGADIRVERPLGAYLDTLDRLAAANYDRAWPGHRDVIEEPSDRAREIIDHHNERTGRVVEVIRETGAATPWEVSAELFGDLEGIHIMHGPGEAFAHLDHLAHHGVLVCEDGSYRLLDETLATDKLVQPGSSRSGGDGD